MLIVGATQIPNNELGLPSDHFTITPHDVNNFTHFARSIYVGTGGDLVLVDAHDVAKTYKNVPDGKEFVGVFKRVNATSTTATDLLGRF